MSIILYNGKVLTMNEKQPYADAVAIRKNKIYRVGSNNEILSLRKDTTDVIDLKGRTLLPGFNDSHMHLVYFADTLNTINLVGSSSIDEVFKRSKAFVEQHPNRRGWIRGVGWNETLFSDNRPLYRKDLDKISTQYPVFLFRACGHLGVINSKALEVLNINETSEQVEGGHFDVKTGIFKENALNLIFESLPVPDVKGIKDRIKMACHLALKEGITSIQTDDFGTFSDKNYNKIIQAYNELIEEGELPIRIYQQCRLLGLDILKGFLDKGYHTGYGNEFFKIGPLKIVSDGSLGARTAYLTEPYSDNPLTCGLNTYAQEELDELIITAHKNRMQVAVHCIGDKAMEMVMSSIEKALQAHPKEDHRHGIIHCQITNKKVLAKFKENDMIGYIQPIFLDSDIPIVEKRVGKQRANHTYNFKTLLDKKVHTPYGSDCPIEPFIVMHGIYCAVTRKTLQGLPDGGWLPDQKVSVEQALYAFTKDGAYASFEEDIKGSIEEGMLADCVVLDRDIYHTSLKELKDIKVDLTIVDGVIRYKR